LPDTITTLGEAIHWLREARGLSLRELARRVGVSAPFLSDIEHNRRATDRLGKLATVLGVDLAELERFDARLPPDVKNWIVSSPGMPSVLREFKDSGLDAYQLRAAVLGKKP